MWAHSGKTAVTGIGFSKLTRTHERSLGRLAIDACRAAIADAGLAPRDIDGLATHPDQPFRGAGNRPGEDLVPAAFLIDHLDLAPEISWYAQVSAGLIPSAIIEAVNALLAGACTHALVWRAMHRPAGTYGRGASRSRRAIVNSARPTATRAPSSSTPSPTGAICTASARAARRWRPS